MKKNNVCKIVFVLDCNMYAFILTNLCNQACLKLQNHSLLSPYDKHDKVLTYAYYTRPFYNNVENHFLTVPGISDIHKDMCAFKKKDQFHELNKLSRLDK